MRQPLLGLVVEGPAHKSKIKAVPDHLGLAYDVWAPIRPGGEGKVSDTERQPWLARLVDQSKQAPEGYDRAFARWKNSFAGDRRTRLVPIETTSRLLVGHGNAAPTEVGLTLHRTWGVPLIPGSALKGLANHFLDACYGPENRRLHPQDPAHPEPDRAPFEGVTYCGSLIWRGPGDVHRILFGAPDSEDRGPKDLGAAAGQIVFHDALWDPASLGTGTAGKGYLAIDVLTVHQKTYYDKRNSWPSDYDDPNPVAFLSVPPGQKFLVALTAVGEEGERWLDTAARILVEALETWGVGGKTGAGYGLFKCHFESEAARAAAAREHEDALWADLQAEVAALTPGSAGQKVGELLDRAPAGRKAELARAIVARLGEKWCQGKKEKAYMQRLLETAAG